MWYIEPLTRRELECLYQAAHDKNCRETAELLCISHETVKTHRSVILRKLGCRTITGAVMVAVREGLILEKKEMKPRVISDCVGSNSLESSIFHRVG